ncbi:MAG: DUF2461 domain-containing protein [Pikeienuella sp.]
MSFQGFGPDACAWFTGLEADNTKDYFAINRAVFDDQIKAPMQALLAAAQLRFGGEAKLFRQHRDVRFSKDKSPYKTACYGGVYNADHVMGWYFAIDRHGVYAGRGIYQMSPDQLANYRDAVVGPNSDGLASAVAEAESAGLELSGSGTKGAPRGYPKDHQHIDLLRRKALIIGGRSADVLGDAPWNHAENCWAGAAPIANWMDRALNL